MTGKKISQADFIVTKDLRVCNQHFEGHCYERDLKSEMLRTSAKYKLEEDAVPGIPSHHLKSVAVNRRKTRFYYASIRLTLVSVIRDSNSPMNYVQFSINFFTVLQEYLTLPFCQFFPPECPSTLDNLK